MSKTAMRIRYHYFHTRKVLGELGKQFKFWASLGLLHNHSCYMAGSALREDTNSSSHIYLDAPENREKNTCLFSVHFPPSFSFSHCICLSHSMDFSYSHWTFSSDQSDFSEAVHLCSQFSLTWTTVCNLRLDYWPYLWGNGIPCGLWY